MTPQNIAWDDTVLPFQLDRSDIRGRVARLDGALDRILNQHAYPPLIEALVAEAALLTALIGQSVKLRWKLSLQIRGNGPARLIAAGLALRLVRNCPESVATRRDRVTISVQEMFCEDNLKFGDDARGEIGGVGV